MAGINPSFGANTMSNPLKESAELLRIQAEKIRAQLAQKRKEVDELELAWIKINRLVREAEGGFIGHTSARNEIDDDF